jgi:hypothetical protein
LANLAREISKRAREAFIDYKLDQARRPMGKKSTLIRTLTRAEETKIRAEAMAEFKDMAITSPEALEGTVTIFQPKLFADGKNRILAVKVDGERKFFQVHNDDLWNSFVRREQQRDKGDGLFARAMKKGATLLRAGATIRPSFIIANLVRDSLVATLQSRNGFIPVWDTLRGMKSLPIAILGRKGDEHYRQFAVRGIGGSTLLGGDRKNIDAAVRAIKSPSKVKQGYELVRHPIHALQRLSELIETSTRVAEFRLAKENISGDRNVGILGMAQRLGDEFAGRIKRGEYTEEDLLRAAMAGADVTTDFSRGGYTAKEISQYKSFFNAQIQGWARIAATGRRDPTGTMSTLGLVMLLSYYLYDHNKDDDEYLELSDDERRRFFFFSMGNGYGIKIAKPFDWAIPANLVEFALLNADDSQAPVMEDLAKALGMFDPTVKLGEGKILGAVPRRLMAHIGTSLTPTLFFPALEALMNYDTFRERPIYDRDDERKPSDLQVRDWTSDTARLMGAALSMSPAVFEHLIHGYGGGLFRDAFMFTDHPARAFLSRNRPEPPSRQTVDQVPGLSSILWEQNYDTRSKSNREFYDTYSRLDGAERAIKDYKTGKGLTDYAKALKEFRKEFPMSRVERLKEAKSDIDDLLAKKNVVRQSRSISPDDKRERIKKIDRFIVNRARVALGRSALR